MLVTYYVLYFLIYEFVFKNNYLNCNYIEIVFKFKKNIIKTSAMLISFKYLDFTKRNFKNCCKYKYNFNQYSKVTTVLKQL